MSGEVKTAVVKHKYRASKTLSEFHADNSLVRGVMGPIGSGKSVGMVNEILMRSFRQNVFEGVRRSRWVVVRNTSLELRNTSLKTVQDWLPPTICKYVYHPQIEAHFLLPLPDGTTVDLEIIFLAMDRPEDVKKLLSLECTGVWLNEARELPYEILDGAIGRTDRHPSKEKGGSAWAGVIMDTNPPDDDHWWAQYADQDTPKGWQFWQQPPALLRLNTSDGIQWIPNRRAENIDFLNGGFDYYLRQVPGKTEQWIRVYIQGKYGTSAAGMPIYRDHYNDDLHVSKYPLHPIKGRPIYLGWDFGLTPCCVIGQVGPYGELRILDELVTDRMGLKFFVEGAVIPLLARKYPGFEVISTCDPAGVGETSNDQLSNVEQLIALGIPTKPARTNDPEQRWEAVRWFLSRMAGGQPGFLLDKRVSVLRKGFNGGYKFRSVKVNGQVRFTQVADKGRYSHPHDALQYLCLAVKPETNVKKPRLTYAGNRVLDMLTGY